MRDLLGWWGFGALSAALLAVAVVVLVRERRRVRALLLRSTAVPLGLFVGVCLVCCLLAAREVPKRLAVPALALDLLLAALTRSGTVIIAGAVVLAVAVLVVAHRRVSRPWRRLLAGSAR